MVETLEYALALSYGNQNILIDSIRAIESLKVLATQENPQALFELALFYDHERGDCILPRNIYFRDQYLLHAAHLGHAQAIITLFDLLKRKNTIFDIGYYDEHYTDQIFGELHQITDQLIAQGNTQALLIKAKHGVAYPDTESMQYLYQAWNQGEKLSASLYLSRYDDEELKQLGLFDATAWNDYFEHAQQDLMQYLEQAFQRGHIQKIIEFLRTDEASYISEQNREQLWQWQQQFYQQQATLGSADAWLQLSRLTENSLNYLKNAVELNHPVAMYAYAYELDQKPDLGNDELDEIEKYFTIAAEHKHAQALYEKGRYYIEDDPELARQYFQQASELGCLDAVEWMVALTEQCEQAHWAELAFKYGSIDNKVAEVLIVALRGGFGIQENHRLADELKLRLEATSYWDQVFSFALPAAQQHYEKQIQPQMEGLFDEIAEQPGFRSRIASHIKNWFK
ncbi:sel1 repeat family protein [Acinetobacter baumannii]|uniref:sel1 repeat family protein n=1 Tax=Acinetobacter baumannii TaxID=470 RepID=UPI0022EA472E|nr:sel1 repeat family protein [Acinetobacter baumannii]MDA3482321.1 sel1 repeat family protein [Acinetobacter baumannii]WGT82414.1 sel1 repeat family protein [Acinetobacter baumannii]